MKVFHGTSADFTGTPDFRTDTMYGLSGCYLTENYEAATDYATAENLTNGGDGGNARIFTAEIDLESAAVLHYDDIEDDEWDFLAEIVDEREIDFVILPDSWGHGTDEIVAVYNPALRWIGMELVAA